jgi:hypothetical protein
MRNESNDLTECVVEEMVLHVPAEHLEGLIGYFDGMHEGDRGAARAVFHGRELKLEGSGGHLVLARQENTFVARELELFDDRGATFFDQVVLSLFLAYMGRLHCRVRVVDASGAAARLVEVVVEDGRTNWKRADPATGAWLSPAGSSGAEPAESFTEEILAKLEEAKRYFAEYVRLKGLRSAKP